jgi:type III secretory pathway component EscS
MQRICLSEICLVKIPFAFVLTFKNAYYFLFLLLASLEGIFLDMLQTESTRIVDQYFSFVSKLVMGFILCSLKVKFLRQDVIPRRG